jgi:hypothetical protein
MKKIIFFFFLLTPFMVFGQIGLKAGYNYAKVSKASDINAGNKSGYHAGVFFAPASKKLLSSRSELLYSHQGYNYKTSSSDGEVDLDYIQVAQFASVNLTKYISVLFGAQTAYLVSATVDSSKNSTSNGTENAIMDLYNRVDYGYSIGVEGHPVLGLIVGVRYNVSLAKIYKDIQSGQRPSFTSEDAKNNVLQLSVGWRFGSKAMKK